MTWLPGRSKRSKLIPGVPPVRVIIDVGSFQGDRVAAYAEGCPEAQIWAFEPVDESYAALVTRFRDISRVHPSSLALSDRPGSAMLHLTSDPEWSSLLAPALDSTAWSDALDPLEGATTRMIQMDTLDGFCVRAGIEQIDLLSLSVQGGELHVLKGAGDLLRAQRIGTISTDVYFAELYRGQSLFRDVDSLLAEYGYLLRDLTGLVHTPSGRLRRARAEFVTAEVERQLQDQRASEPAAPVQVYYVPFGPNVLIVMCVDHRVDAESVEVAVNSAPDGSWSGEWTYLTTPPLNEDGSTSVIWDTRSYADGDYLIAINIRLKNGETLWWGDQPFRTYRVG